MALSQQIDSVKVSLGEELRRFPYDQTTSFSLLVSQIQDLFSLGSNPYSLKYRDEEGDLISITRDSELLEAVRLQLKANSSILRLFIIVPPHPLPQPIVETLPSPASPCAPSPGCEVPLATTFAPSFYPDHQRYRYHGNNGGEYRGRCARHEAKRQLKDEKLQLKQVYKDEKRSWKDSHLETRLDARFVKDVSFSPHSKIAGATSFVKTWRVRNDGSSPWPAAFCRVEFKKGDKMSALSNSFSLSTKDIAVGEELDISIALVAPANPGKYVAVWKLTTDAPGGYKNRVFGHPLKLKIRVPGPDSGSSSSSDSEGGHAGKKEKRQSFGQLLSQLDQMGFTDKKTNIRLIKETHRDVDKVVALLVQQQQQFLLNQSAAAPRFP